LFAIAKYCKIGTKWLSHEFILIHATFQVSLFFKHISIIRLKLIAFVNPLFL